MPIVEHKQRDEFTLYSAPVEQEAPPPSLFETAAASFRMENDVLNAYTLLTRDTFPENPDFHVGDWLRSYDRDNGTRYWDNNRDSFLGSKSEEEALSRVQRIEQENKDRLTRERAGWTGTVFDIAAGSLSPTLFIPFMGPARGAKAVATAAGLAGIAAGISEMPLQLNQETRTAGETIMSVGASAIVGGLLGGAVVALRPGERELIEQSMVPFTGDKAIPTSAGAAANETLGTGGQLASGPKTVAKVLNSNPLTRNPVIDTIEGSSDAARARMQVLSDAGLAYENNVKGVPTIAGGTVENSIADYYSKFAKGIERYDSAYADYVFEGGAEPSFLKTTRAGFAAKRQGKMSKKDFNEAVYDAMLAGDQHEIPQVAKAAKAWREEIYDPMLREAQAAGIIPEELKDMADLSYLNRVYDTQAIRANPVKFIDIVANHIERKLQKQFDEEMLRLTEKNRQQDELIQDLQRPAPEVNRLREQFQKELADIQNIVPADIAQLEDQIGHARMLAREVTKNPPPGISGVEAEATRRQLLKDARDMEQVGGEELGRFRSMKANLRRRLTNLSKSRAVLEQKQSKKLDTITALEQANIDTLERVARKGYDVLKKLDKVSDKQLDAEVSRLRSLFAAAANQFDRAEERLAKIVQSESADSDAFGKLVYGDDVVQQKADKLTDIAQRLEDAENLDRGELRAIITSGLELTAEQVSGVVTRRGKRIAKLEAQAAKLDPAQVTSRIEDIKAGQRVRIERFEERQRALGSEDPTSGDFKLFAREAAEKFKDKVLGTYLRLPAYEVLGEERGAELARFLDIDSQQIRDFVVRDTERLARTYLRTLAPDINLKQRYGTLNVGEIWTPVVEEMNRKLQAIADDPKLSEATKAKRSQALDAEYRRYKENFEGVWARIRHTRGLPDNPEGIAYRAADTIMKLNVMRMMGRVVISSVADVQRPIQRYGLTRVFRDAFVPMITNFKEMRMNMLEARRMQGGLDPVLQGRGRAIFDVMDDLQRGTKFERGVDAATARFGLIALFDQWTDVMKQYAGSVANAKVMDSLAMVNRGEGTAKQQQKAIAYLAELGFGPAEVQRIWQQVESAGGGAKVNGLWWPNTAAWTDADAIKMYHSAINREADIVIVTPGVDKPLWMDANMTGRVLSQFKGFGMAATTKMIMSGLQQRDMAFINGTVISLALGALSYYLYGVAAGGKAYEDMMKADAGKWADEAIDRSGILAILSEVRRVGETIPAVAPYVTFSGERTTRRGGEDFVGALGGPSLDFLEKLATIITGIHDPTRSTGHALRTLMPGQNTPIISKGYDAIEAAAALKERREQ